MNVYAVVGMGSIAKRHLTNLRTLYPEDKICVVSASGLNAKLPAAADAIVTLDELILLQPIYVIIASPAPYHVETAIKLLENNVAVLIEKPLADRIQSALDIQSFCRDNLHKPVAVGYCLRFLPSALAVKEFLAQGKLGEIYNVASVVGQYLPGWRSDKNFKDSVSASKALGGGALLELSHELDYLRWLFGDLTLQHSWLRTTKELGLDVEEIADLIMTSDKGLYITVHLDFVQKATQRKCEFIGEKGRLVWDLIANSVTFHDAEQTVSIYSDALYNKNNMYMDMLNTFDKVSQQGMQQLASIQSSVSVVQLIEEAKRANKWRSTL